MHLLRQELLVRIFVSPRLVALFNRTLTYEMALYNLLVLLFELFD